MLLLVALRKELPWPFYMHTKVKVFWFYLFFKKGKFLIFLISKEVVRKKIEEMDSRLHGNDRNGAVFFQTR